MQKRKRPFSLKDYQQDAVAKINIRLREQLSTLLAMATGCGKTICYLAWLLGVLLRGQRALIIAHRRELIYQPIERMRQFFPSLYARSGIVMAEQRDVDADVIVATVQSLNSGMRLNEILAHGKINWLVTDECHHSPSDSYTNVYKRLYEANPHMRHLGVTATPRRTDDVALRAVFASVADRLNLSDAIKIGALVPFVVLGTYVETVKLDHLPQFKGDWSKETVGKVMSEKAILDTAVAKWLELAGGRQTIAFCATTGQAHKTAKWFRDAGITAEAADYKTDKRERAAILERFRSGKTKVICNFGLWREGLDLPMAEVALMLRPTTSDSLYIQMVGRVLRTFPPHKKTALILDIAPAATRDMIMGGDLLGGTPRKQKRAEDKAADLGIIPAYGINRGGKGIDGDPDDVLVEVLNYLIKSTLAWKKDDGIATIGLNDTKTLVVVFPDEERIADAEKFRNTPQWNDACQREVNRISKLRVFAIEQAGRRAPKSVRALGVFDSWDDSIPTTEDYADQHQDAALARRSKRWRKLDATEGQTNWARRMVAADDTGERNPLTMKRGPLAQWLTHRSTLNLLKRKRLTR